MPIDTHAETSESRGGWPEIELSLPQRDGGAPARPERSRRAGGGSGKCANPLGCRYGRCFGNVGAGAVGVAESAETSPGAKWWVQWRVGNGLTDGKHRFTGCFEAGWRRGWDSNPRYACTHNGFRDRPDRPLWHLSGAPLIGGRFCRGNSAVGEADLRLFSPESGLSGVDLGGFLRIFRPPPAGHSGPPRSFVLSGILGMGPANPPNCCGVEGRVRSIGRF
jgi:hypothetical protein